MTYRVEDLAARAGISVDTVRFYQSKALLPAPERSGRVALYSDLHLERLEDIKKWKARGLTLEAIRRVFSHEIQGPDRALVDALVAPLSDAEQGGRPLSRAAVAELTGVSQTVLDAVSRSGLLGRSDPDGEPIYTEDDVRTIEAGMALLQAGLPLSELLALAREHDEAARTIARHAVDAFVRYVRDPIRVEADDDEEAAERLLAAFRAMIPAVSTLVESHFRRTLLEAGIERLEQMDDDRPQDEGRGRDEGVHDAHMQGGVDESKFEEARPS